MTEALFRHDAYLKECEATIVGHTDQGVILDRSVFYPEGGGQPGDRGALTITAAIGGDTANTALADGAEINIIDTRKLDNGEIEHILHDANLLNVLPVETRVHAAIDWTYRYRHMRMHTCLHLLCALIPFDVTGGSLNQDKGRLDFDMTEGVDKEELASKLNALIVKRAPVAHQWISDEEMLENMALVRTMSVAPPTGQGKVRLVAVEDIDLQPCGGTHVANTEEIGKVRIGKVEKKGKHNRRINLHLED